MDLRPDPINKTFARACDRTSYYLNTCFWDLKMGQFWGQNGVPNLGPYLEGCWRGQRAIGRNMHSEGTKYGSKIGPKMGQFWGPKWGQFEVPFCYADLRNAQSKIWHQNHEIAKMTKMTKTWNREIVISTKSLHHLDIYSRSWNWPNLSKSGYFHDT